MAALTEIEWESCLVEPTRDRELEAEVRRRVGAVPPSVRYFAACPWLVRSLLGIDLADGLLVHTHPDFAERIWLAVSQDNSCRYCYAAHRFFLRLLGLSEQRIRRLEQDLFTAELDPGERLAVDFARRLSRANPLPGAGDLDRLRGAGYGDEAILELVFAAAFVSAANRVATLPAIPAEPVERAPDRWLVRLARPWLERRLRARRRPGRREPLPAELRSGPYSYLVLAFDGLPVAPPLRHLLDAALDSPILARRAKLLVIAVVARGLGCALSEREAAGLLAAEGLGPTELEPILAHLGSPALTPVEAEILPLARDTIWYRPAPIQRRARAVSERLGAARFLEFCGVASVANLICRLEIVAPAP